MGMAYIGNTLNGNVSTRQPNVIGKLMAAAMGRRNKPSLERSGKVEGEVA
jgi:hypothetical protein